MPTPAGLASLTPVSLTAAPPTPASPTTGLPTLGSPTRTTVDFLTSPVPVSATAAVSPAPMPAGSQVHAPIPADATIFALDQSPTVPSPSISAASFTPALPTPSTPLAKAEPSSVVTPIFTSVLNTSSEQPFALSARNQGPAPSTDPVSNIVSPASSAPTPALTPALQPIRTPQSPVNENNLAPLTEPTTAKQPAAPQSSDSKVGNSAPVVSAPVNSVPINPSAVNSALRNISNAEPSPRQAPLLPTPPRPEPFHWMPPAMQALRQHNLPALQKPDSPSPITSPITPPITSPPTTSRRLLRISLRQISTRRTWLRRTPLLRA